MFMEAISKLETMIKRTPWDVRLQRAKKRGYFTKEDKHAAGNWCRCSIGERLGFPVITEIYRESEYAPSMGLARDLGYSFSDAVKGDNITDAARIHSEIQKLPMKNPFD